MMVHLSFVGRIVLVHLIDLLFTHCYSFCSCFLSFLSFSITFSLLFRLEGFYVGLFRCEYSAQRDHHEQGHGQLLTNFSIFMENQTRRVVVVESLATHHEHAWFAASWCTGALWNHAQVQSLAQWNAACHYHFVKLHDVRQLFCPFTINYLLLNRVLVHTDVYWELYNIFHSYRYEVLETGWLSLQESLKKATSLDDLIQAHENYQNDILSAVRRLFGTFFGTYLYFLSFLFAHFSSLRVSLRVLTSRSLCRFFILHLFSFFSFLGALRSKYRRSTSAAACLVWSVVTFLWYTTTCVNHCTGDLDTKTGTSAWRARENASGEMGLAGGWRRRRNDRRRGEYYLMYYSLLFTINSY